jgi:hypothetical protein
LRDFVICPPSEMLGYVRLFPLALQTDETQATPSPSLQHFLVLNAVVVWYATPCIMVNNIPGYQNNMLYPGSRYVVGANGMSNISFWLLGTLAKLRKRL